MTPERPWQPDSVSLLRDGGIIPIWALTQDAPVIWPDGVPRIASAAEVTGCLPQLEIELVTERIATRFDSSREVTELYERDYGNGWIARYDIATDLSYTTTAIPIDNAVPWLAEDLNGDGGVEIVSQWAGSLLIHSSPDGTLLADFQWPGFNVVAYPVAVNIDQDPYLEIFATPSSFSSSRVVLIKYDAVLDSFVIIADESTPLYTGGHAAVGDFDGDGRTEFIVGNEQGYGLYEWQDTALVYIDQVGGPALGNDYYATTARPKPGGQLHAILGHSSGSGVRRYELIAATADNVFEIVHVFEKIPSAVGIHPSAGMDVDCDGLDELIFDFYPVYESWHWDSNIDDFVPGCTWNTGVYGTFVSFHRVDLDQDGRAEWGTVSHLEQFRAFPDTGCVYCDVLDLCPFPSEPCAAGCQSADATPTTISFSLYNGEVHDPQSVDIQSGGCDEPWWVGHSSNWLQVTPPGGLTTGSLSVSVDFADLTAPDTLRDTIVILSRCSTWPQAKVGIELVLSPACECACHADPTCDGAVNVLDVVAAVDVAFRNADPDSDPMPNCPRIRTDADCDGVTNIIDVVRFVNVAFRGGDPATEFCDPCDPIIGDARS